MKSYISHLRWGIKCLLFMSSARVTNSKLEYRKSIVFMAYKYLHRRRMSEA